MLNKLNKKQIALIDTVKQEWLDRLFSCKLRTDRKKATKYINWMYKLAGLKKPLVVFLSSPLGTEYGANMLNKVNGSQVGSQVRSQMWSQMWSHVESQVRSQVESHVESQVRSQLWSQVESLVGSQVESQMWSQNLNYYPFSWYGSISDYGWISLYNYFKRLGIVKLGAFNNFMALMKAGVYDMIHFENVCLVSDMPTKITRDEQNRLHNQTGYAIEWADGYGQYWYHGVSVTEKIIKTPERLTKKDWSNKKNAEVRRVIQKVMPDFAKKIGGKVIDKSKQAELLEVELPEDSERIAHYIKVKDTSTKRVYYLRTPPTITSADESLAWTFGVESKDYKLEQES